MSQSSVVTETVNIFNNGCWTRDEHQLFLRGLEIYGSSWGQISSLVKTRTKEQVSKYAQKYFQKHPSRKRKLQREKKQIDSSSYLPHKKRECLEVLSIAEKTQSITIFVSKNKHTNKDKRQTKERRDTFPTIETKEKEKANRDTAKFKRTAPLLDLSGFPRPLMRADDVLRQVRAKRAKVERMNLEHVMPLVIGGDYTDLLPSLDELDPILKGGKISCDKSVKLLESQGNNEDKRPDEISKQVNFDDQLLSSSLDESDPLLVWEKSNSKVVSISNSKDNNFSQQNYQDIRPNKTLKQKNTEDEVKHTKIQESNALIQKGRGTIGFDNFKMHPSAQNLSEKDRALANLISLQGKQRKFRNTLAVTKIETTQQSLVTTVSHNVMKFLNAEKVTRVDRGGSVDKPILLE